MQPQHLANAPILEALVDLRVRPRVDLDVHSLGEVLGLRERYPICEQMKAIQFQVKHESNAPPVQSATDLGTVGFRYSSPSDTCQAQCRKDGFTFNMLKPYSGWPNLRRLSMEAWAAYLGVARPEEVTRIALRYINKAPIAETTFDLGGILRGNLDPFPGLQLEFGGLGYRALLRDIASDNRAVVQVTLEEEPSALGHTLALDIDVSRLGSFSLTGQSIPDVLESLREFKNRLFFEMITDNFAKRFL